MAVDSRTSSSNFFVHGFGQNNHVNLNFISTNFHFTQNHHHHHHPTSSSRHSNLTYAAAALVNFLELKYQGKKESPFETHPKTMFLAVASLLLYCLAYDAKSRFNSCINVRICCRGLMALFGPLLLAALLSVLLPQLLCPVLFPLSILLSLFELPISKIIKLWEWNRWIFRESIWVETLPVQQQQQGRARRPMTPYPLGLLENVLVEEDEYIHVLSV